MLSSRVVFLRSSRWRKNCEGRGRSCQSVRLQFFHLNCLQLLTVSSTVSSYGTSVLLLLCPELTSRFSFTTATLCAELCNEQQLSLHEQSQNVLIVGRILFLVPHFMDAGLQMQLIQYLSYESFSLLCIFFTAILSKTSELISTMPFATLHYHHQWHLRCSGSETFSPSTDLPRLTDHYVQSTQTTVILWWLWQLWQELSLWPISPPSPPTALCS